jgi:hypothetical protein
MSLGNLLASDYQKSIKEFIRFVIIIGNLLAFYFFCGMRAHGRFGPRLTPDFSFAPWNPPREVILEDPLQYTSSLDMIALILAVYVAMKQLTFGRPEIDSFNQIIYLLPQEKNATLLLLLFTIYKAAHQYFYNTINLSTNVNLQTRYQENTRNRSWLLLSKNSPVGYLNPSTARRPRYTIRYYSEISS